MMEGDNVFYIVGNKQSLTPVYYIFSIIIYYITRSCKMKDDANSKHQI